MFKKTLMLCLLAVVITALGACSGEKKSALEGTGDQMKSSGSAAGGMLLKVTAPGGWLPNASNPDMMMKGTGSYSIKVETMPAQASTPDSFMDFIKDTFNRSFKNCKFGNPVSLKVSGLDARRLDYSAQVAGMTMNYIVLYVFTEGKAHTLTCAALGSEFGTLKGDIEKIVASARME